MIYVAVAGLEQMRAISVQSELFRDPGNGIGVKVGSGKLSAGSPGFE
jgi:hypothetical protein